MNTMQRTATYARQSIQKPGLFIDVLDATDIRCWSTAFVITPIELKQAVAKVGPSAERVRAYFGLSAFDVWPTTLRQQR